MTAQNASNENGMNEINKPINLNILDRKARL